MSDKKLNNIDESNVVVDQEQTADNNEVQAEQTELQKKNFFASVGSGIANIGKTVWRWIKRAFMGGDKELSEKDKFNVENIESPLKQMTKEFFRRKIAVVALVVLVCMFAFVFIGPLFVPMDVNYTDTLQQNIAPNYTMMKVPNALKNDIKSISSFSNFSVGLSNSGKMYIWGDTKLRLAGVDLADFPEEIKDDNVAFVSAGKDHIVAITKEGKVVAWGANSNGQYGHTTAIGAVEMPEELISGTIDPSQVSQLVCGYQVTAIVMKDGSVYVWGNGGTVKNLAEIAQMTNVAKIEFSTATAMAILKDGTFTTGSKDYFTSVVSSVNGTSSSLSGYLNGREVIDVVAADYSIALLLDGNELVMSGVFENNEDKIPQLPEGEYFTQIDAGTRHYVGVTNKGNCYGWGHSFYGQAGFDPDSGASKVFAGAMQTYVVNESDDLIATHGLKGYLMGTDGSGRDIFTRIVHGGKMTMTVGAVAVIVSSIIAIIIGCLSGYFGGWVDMLLMRITEIFASIPFLPFAMMLSLVIRNYPVDETTRIVIIMVMLGLLSWTGLARMIRGQVLAEREKEFVIAAKAMGIKESRIAFKHILPNVISVILVSMTLSFAGCLLTESSLSYLGFGVQQPQPTWGNMLNGANNSIVIQNYWWQWLFPSIFLAMATISINVIGDTLRDVLDPKSTLDK